eukprot:TRINITY_DN37962_c0_g1_i1.p1 TRINITY_DN37962_c0_g1~~TRINITY_DN37962_c0_g1_i1.p1  ORF type:complete len:126 (-),score=32.07 TRINITY_DN37962_c0_g1_i1:106-483(-)
MCIRDRFPIIAGSGGGGEGSPLTHDGVGHHHHRYSVGSSRDTPLGGYMAFHSPQHLLDGGLPLSGSGGGAGGSSSSYTNNPSPSASPSALTPPPIMRLQSFTLSGSPTSGNVICLLYTSPSPRDS